MKNFLLILLLFLSGSSLAQLAVKFIQLRPTGEFGMVMNRQLSGELLYLEEFDERTRFRAGISYAQFQPRLDTFPVYIVETSGSSGTRVIEGYDTFEKFNMTLLFAGMDVNLLDNEKFHVYPGFDIMVGGFDVSRRTVSYGVRNESFNGGLTFGGLRFRAGTEYMLGESIGIFLEASRSFYLTQEMGGMSHNDIGIGTHIIF